MFVFEYIYIYIYICRACLRWVYSGTGSSGNLSIRVDGNSSGLSM